MKATQQQPKREIGHESNILPALQVQFPPHWISLPFATLSGCCTSALSEIYVWLCILDPLQRQSLGQLHLGGTGKPPCLCSHRSSGSQSQQLQKHTHKRACHSNTGLSAQRCFSGIHAGMKSQTLLSLRKVKLGGGGGSPSALKP